VRLAITSCDLSKGERHTTMKTDERYEEQTSQEPDHDNEWREKIQRALRDLRSVSASFGGTNTRHPQQH